MATFDSNLDDETVQEWSATSAQHMPSPELEFKSASVAIARWQSMLGSFPPKVFDYVVAGRRYAPSQAHHDAILQLYDANTNKAVWSGNIVLDQQGIIY